MRKICFFIIILVLSTIACGVFGGGDSEEIPKEPSPTEVAGELEPSEEAEPSSATNPPAATDIPKSPEKDVPIEPKPKGSEIDPTPAVIEMPISSQEEGLPDDMEEIYLPYEVAQYQRGVEITVLDFRSYKPTYSETERFIGIIMNTGTVNLYNIHVYIIALDENGEELASSFDVAHLSDFPIGGKSGFTVSSGGEGFSEGTARLLIAFDGTERYEWATATQDFEILSAEGAQEPHTIWGTVYNIALDFRSNAEFDTWLIQAAALLYNSDGRIIGVCRDEVEDRSDSVIPGEEGEIAISCKSVYGIVDYFEITVEGSQTAESIGAD